MKINIDGVEHRLYFRYSYAVPTERDLRKATWEEVPGDQVSSIRSDDPITEAHIHELAKIPKDFVYRTTTAVLATGPKTEEESIIAQGVAYCSPEDNFNKERGRRVALHRLLALIPMGEHKKAVWQAYAQSRPVVKEINANVNPS